MRNLILLSLSICFLFGCSATPNPTISPTQPLPTSKPAGQITPTEPKAPLVIPDSGNAAYLANHRIGKGVNLGDALEAPKEGDWGVNLQSSYFSAIKTAGFNTVRVPIGWTFHALKTSPYTIDENFFMRVDWVITQAEQNGLMVILDMHNYPEVMQDPKTEKDRFLALWDQISRHYKDYPDDVLFELLNEPNGGLNEDAWNSLLKDAIPLVRKSNPDRMLIVGPAGWNGIHYLDYLELPAEDHNIIVTIHYYNPMHLTHQGASWVDGSNAWLGTTWTGSPAERMIMRVDIDQAVRWAVQHVRPLYLGEFGCISNADPASRLAWTGYLVHLAETRQLSWSYWIFADSAGNAPGFGAYDLATNTWRKTLVDTLITTR